MHHSFKMSYLEPILVHPVRRQIFGDTSGQTFYMTRDPVIQGLPERMSKVNPFARALIFTKSGFSGVFWDEK